MRQAEIVPLDPAIAAENIRKSVRPCASNKHEAMLTELNCLGPAGTSEDSPAHMVQMSAFPNRRHGISLQKKMVIVLPAMLEQSEGYRQSGVLPLYSKCDWTRYELASAGRAPCGEPEGRAVCVLGLALVGGPSNHPGRLGEGGDLG